MAAYLQGIWKCRFFWFSLVRMDLRTRYRGSVIGVGWSLLHPVAMTVVLCTVFRHLFHMDVREFAPYLFAGLTLWSYIVTTATQGCFCFFNGESYIRQHPAPMAIYPLRTTLGTAFHFGIGLLLVIALGIWSQGHVAVVALLSLLPSLVLFLLAGWSLATLFGLANVRFRDTSHLAEVGFQVLFYATPIMYKPSALPLGRLRTLLSFNPVMPFLELLRQPIIDGRVPGSSVYLSAGLIVLVLVAAASLALRHDERRLIFHL
jgi:ABC-type polysaccharide/polyol phosphate export permease